jgi:hypothetical protein
MRASRRRGLPLASVRPSVDRRARFAPMTAISAASATESRETANPLPDLPEIRGHDASPQPASRVLQFPTPRFGDYLWTRFEVRSTSGDRREVANDPPNRSRN